MNSNSGATWVSATVTHLARPYQPQTPWPGSARPVLMLDWGTRGTTEHNRLSTGALEAWLNFCCQYLAAQCPKDLRLISCLTIEIAQERHLALENAP